LTKLEFLPLAIHNREKISSRQKKKKTMTNLKIPKF